MIGRPISRPKAVLLSVLSVLMLLVGYTWVSHRQHQVNPNDTTIPSWGQLAEGVKKFTQPDRKGDRWLVEDSLATGERLALGLALGIVFGFLIGMLMGCISPVEAFLHPPISMLAKVPQTAALAVYFTQGCGSLDCVGGELVCGLARAECICDERHIGQECETRCGEYGTSDGAQCVWNSTATVMRSGHNGAFVQAVEYTGPPTNLTWELQRSLCAAAGRPTTGPASSWWPTARSSC